MRNTTTRLFLAPTLLGLSLVACVPDAPRPGPGPKDCSKPENVEMVTDPVVIENDGDFDQVPTSCWDLYSTLTVRGSNITSLAKLGDLRGIDHLQLIDTKLTTLDVKKPLKVYGLVEITGNTQLKDLKNLEVEHASDDPVVVPVRVNIDDNAVLASLDGLADLTMVDTSLTITNNPKLTAISLHRLASIGISRPATNTSADVAVTIADNTALTSVELPKLSGVVGTVTVRNNPALTMLGGMGSLDQLNGDLTIENNAALASVGLIPIKYVVGTLRIVNNHTLADLGQASRLTGISSITINSNPNLSQCLAQEVQQCVLQHGASAISNNKPATGCTYWCTN